MTTTSAIRREPAIDDAYTLLENSMVAVLETYANVHRGSGPASAVTTYLYDKARLIVLAHLGLRPRDYTVIFCSPYRASLLAKTFQQGAFQMICSSDIGLNLGVAAIAVRRNTFPKGTPSISGGGTTRLYGGDWVMWGAAPDRFEAGTPAIVSCIAFAKALLLIGQYGEDAFSHQTAEACTVDEILFVDSLKELSGKELLTELRQQWIGHGVEVPCAQGTTPLINLDNGASTPALMPVWEAFKKAYRQPEAVRHDLIPAVKKLVSASFNAPEDDYEVLFTANTTEAINLVAGSIANSPADGTEPQILGSILEHSSNDLPWRNVPNHGFLRLSVDKHGFFDLDEPEKLLSDYNLTNAHGNKRIRLVAVSGASNITGSCNDLYAIGRLCKRYGAHLLVDAAQLVAHRSIDMEACGIDFMAFSGHKMYAPFGSGALIMRKGLLPFTDQELQAIRSSGEANPGGIAALGKALQLLHRIGFGMIEAEEQKLLRKALKGISSIKGAKIYGMPVDGEMQTINHTGVLCFDVKNKLNSSLAKNLGHGAGIGTRFGCLCAHIYLKHLLNFTPMQENIQRFALRAVPVLNLQGVLRVSFGLQNTEQDVELMLNRLMKKSRIPAAQWRNFLARREADVYHKTRNLVNNH
jgi:selenocysteine lyase/cysteine desulfurase